MPPQKRKRPHGDDDEAAAASPPGRPPPTRRVTRHVATASTSAVELPPAPVRKAKRGWGGRRTKGKTVAEMEREDAERAARALLESQGEGADDAGGGNNKTNKPAEKKTRAKRTTAAARAADTNTSTRRTLRDGKALPTAASAGRPRRRRASNASAAATEVADSNEEDDDGDGNDDDDDDDNDRWPASTHTAHTAHTAPLTETAGAAPAPRLLAAAAAAATTPGSSAQKPPRQPRQPRRSAAAAAAAAPPTTPATTAAPASAPAPPPPSPGRPDRNIDKVVLGGICFRAWYPSYYGKEVLGDTPGHAHQHHYHPGRGGGGGGGRGGGAAAGQRQQGRGQYQGNKGKAADGAQRDGAAGGAPLLDRLYVCPFCFKYSKEIVPWYGHVQLCERQFQIPGEKVYVHPKGVRTVRVPAAAAEGGGGGAGRRRKGHADADAGDVAYVDQVERDEGEWSVWEVDGEKDVLFCQNLSLFAKLFLDNKSVFFDVTGFDYFLLVYTPPPPPPPPSPSPATSAPPPPPPPPLAAIASAARPQVVGFFSKEKMSWDNNNLACILVFPPWQRKGLGALLMGVSYEISRREGVLGGPEKPISDLGKRGYKRFWAGEIARWLLGIDVEAAAAAPAAADDPPSVVIDVADCSRATWIVRDDCLLVLREMGVVEDAGLGPPKKACSNVLPPAPPPVAAAAADDPSLPVSSPSSPASPTSPTGAAGAAPGGPLSLPSAAAAPPADPPKDVQRVRISKAAVRQWLQEHHIRLDKACDPAGFLKVYARKDGLVDEA